MVNPDVDYQELEVLEGERWIIAKELVQELMTKLERGFTVKDEFKGKKLEGLEYINPLSNNLRLNLKNSYRVVLSKRYVSIEDGTGLVHCAPGHGKEDYEVGKENNLDIICPVGVNGLLTEETGKYSGKKAREVDKEIIEDLRLDNKLIYEMEYEHDYPLCWRDKSPLLMVSLPQWFLKISDIQKKLLRENEKVHWNPEYMKLRMKAWLEGIGDWPVSRQRYWGTPLPIWYDEETGEKMVVGSIDELKKLSGVKNIDLHKPGIDSIEIKGKNGKKLRRVGEVLDVWFDSGVASWAALGYPRDKDKMKKYWPADLNIEGRDQFRGWWNSQMILSQILFDKKPFDSIVVHGMVLDISKKKMSKSEGNIISPKEIIDKYGRDFMRYYFAKFSKGDDFSYDEDEFKEIRKNMVVLGNVNTFIDQIQEAKNKEEIEDKWILSKYHRLLEEVCKGYDKYSFYESIEKIESFLIRDLSRTYIKIIRDRAEEVKEVLKEIRIGLLKMLAPIMPFTTEKIWQDLLTRNSVREESIHLTDWPKVNKKRIDDKLEKDFDKAMKIIEMGLSERDKSKIGLKWPLSRAIVHGSDKFDKELIEIIERQLNVKKIEFKAGKEMKVELDTKMNDELEGEGFAREIARKIQSERKNRGLQKGQLIEIKINVSKKLKNLINNWRIFLEDRVNAKKIEFSDENLGKEEIVFTVKDEKISFSFRNLQGVKIEKDLNTR